jgi:hypothetical protein
MPAARALDQPFQFLGAGVAEATAVPGGAAAVLLGASNDALAAGALPFKNRFTQVVLSSSAVCTENEPTATAPRNSGMPTVGLTTSHSFP